MRRLLLMLMLIQVAHCIIETRHPLRTCREQSSLGIGCCVVAPVAVLMMNAASMAGVASSSVVA